MEEIDNPTKKPNLYRDKKYTSLITDNLDGTHSRLYEDPFLLYQYETDSLLIDIRKDGVETKEIFLGLIEVDINKNNFIANKYWTAQEGIFIQAEEYIENQKYYTREPYVLYYDPYKPYTFIMLEDMKNRILSEANHYGQIEILDEIEVYDTKITFDGNVMDLSETKEYKINQIVMFNELLIDSGVVLNYGCET
jgi:hypothetical protein